MLTIYPINNISFNAARKSKQVKKVTNIDTKTVTPVVMPTALGVYAIAEQKINKKQAELQAIEQDRQTILNNAEKVKFMFQKECKTTANVARDAEKLLNDLEKSVLHDYANHKKGIINTNNRAFTEVDKYNVKQYDNDGNLLYEMHVDDDKIKELVEYIPGTNKKNVYSYALGCANDGRVKLIAKIGINRNDEKGGTRYDFHSIEIKNHNLKIDDSQFMFIHHFDNESGLKWGQHRKGYLGTEEFLETEQGGVAYKFDKNANLTQIHGPYDYNNIPWTSIAKRVDFDRHGNITRYNTGIEYNGSEGYKNVNGPDEKQSDEHYLTYFKVDKAYQMIDGKLQPVDKLEFAKQLFREQW